MPAHIGIVACSAEGAALCYRTLCTEAPRLLGPYAHPEVSLHAQSLADYVACICRGDWAGRGGLMLASARKLAASGADFLICPDNTIHQAFRSSRLGRRCPGCTSRRWWRPRRCGADSGARAHRDAVAGRQRGVPGEARRARARLGASRSADERREISRIIMEELVNGRFLPEGVARSRWSSGG